VTSNTIETTSTTLYWLPFNDFTYTQIPHRKKQHIRAMKTQKACVTTKTIWVCFRGVFSFSGHEAILNWRHIWKVCDDWCHTN